MNTHVLTHCVVWRTGTPEAPQWHRSEPLTKDAAQVLRTKHIANGTRAFVTHYRLSVSLGLPKGWDWKRPG